MGLENFNPQIWAAKLFVRLRKSLVHASTVNRDYEGEIRSFGDTVRINEIGPVDISDYTKYDDITWQELDSAQKMLLIDQAKSFSFQIDDSSEGNGDGVLDPNETMLIGTAYGCSTDEGYLDAKASTLNPNFAAVIIDLLFQAGVEQGDTIALAYTGSMPGANIAVLAACEIMDVKPVIISSVGASWYGATDTNFTWLDIENKLYNEKIFSHKSLMASIGGKSDVGRGLTRECQEALQSAISRNDLNLIYEKDWRNSIKKRVTSYGNITPISHYKTFINIGGGITNVGVGDYNLKNGVLFPEDLMTFQNECVLKTLSMLRGVLLQHHQSKWPQNKHGHFEVPA
jgi:poly-gamma-glutamate system protein